MASVNDLIRNWWYEGCVHCGGPRQQAEMLGITAEDAWHPVSEPPTEADGDHDGFVLTINGRGSVDSVVWHEAVESLSVDQHPPHFWARIRDVVLLPPEEQE